MRVIRGLDIRPETSPPIGQALALNALGGDGGALEIGDVAGVVSEIELAEVTFQVFGRNPLVVAGDPALEDREIIFDGVGVPKSAAHVFFNAVVDGSVPTVLPTDALVVTSFVGHEV